MALRLQFAAVSHVGLIRPGNEDSAYAGPHLLVVADGMGGHAAGEIASAAVVRVLAEVEPPLPVGPDADVAALLRGGIARAGAELRRIVTASPDVEGMGTTVTALLQVGERVAVAQVGDSRGYLLRDGVLEQVTHDQTYVQTLVDEGRIRADEAGVHPQRNLLLQTLDGRPEVDPDVDVRTPVLGDRYLLCSDGLSGVLSEATLRETLAAGTPQEAADRLVDLALRAGAPDNVTAVVADLVDDAGDGPAPPRPMLVGAVVPENRAGPAGEGAETDGGETERGDDDLSAESPAQRGRLRRIGLVLPVVLLVALVGLGGWLGYRWTQQQYFVGEDQGQVVIYRGVSGSIAGRSLSQIVEPTDLDVAELPTYAQQQVTATIPADDLADARAIVTRLSVQAAACATTVPLPSGCASSGESPSPSATPSAVSIPTLSATPSPVAS